MKFKFLLIATIVTLLGAATAHADATFGVNVDWNKFRHSNGSDWGLGARLGFGGGGVEAVTAFDYFFVDADDFITNNNSTNDFNLKFWELNENITYTVPGPVRPYFGAGVGFARRTFNEAFQNFFSDKRNKFGWNVLGGLKFGKGPVSPFIEARGTFYSGNDFPDRFVVSGGVIF